MKLKIMRTCILAVFFFMAGVFVFSGGKSSAKTYKITPSTKPCNKWKPNKHNKHYLVLRSYLMKMEKKGGTLVLQKGTYKISNTLYVPSNVTILMKDGVKLVKHNKSGLKEYEASNSLFQLIRDSKHLKKNAVGGHNGEKNIHFIGEGNVTIDMKNFNKNNTSAALAIILGNNTNVSIENITFKNIKLGHFIEMDGSKDVTITNCTFTGMADNSFHNKEAINIDTNDKLNGGGFTSDWCKADKTPNENVTISGCTFTNLVRAIGTHKYSEGKYHTNIKITDNTISGCMSAFGVLNWENVEITGNTVSDCVSNSKYQFIAFFAGASEVTVADNTFTNCDAGLMMFRVYENFGLNNGSKYPPTENHMSDQELENLENNTFTDCTELIYKVVGL